MDQLYRSQRPLGQEAAPARTTVTATDDSVMPCGRGWIQYETHSYG